MGVEHPAMHDKTMGSRVFAGNAGLWCCFWLHWQRASAHCSLCARTRVSAIVAALSPPFQLVAWAVLCTALRLLLLLLLLLPLLLLSVCSCHCQCGKAQCRTQLAAAASSAAGGAVTWQYCGCYHARIVTLRATFRAVLLMLHLWKVNVLKFNLNVPTRSQRPSSARDQLSADAM